MHLLVTTVVHPDHGLRVVLERCDFAAVLGTGLNTLGGLGVHGHLCLGDALVEGIRLAHLATSATHLIVLVSACCLHGF